MLNNIRFLTVITIIITVGSRVVVSIWNELKIKIRFTKFHGETSCRLNCEFFLLTWSKTLVFSTNRARSKRIRAMQCDEHLFEPLWRTTLGVESQQVVVNSQVSRSATNRRLKSEDRTVTGETTAVRFEHDHHRRRRRRFPPPPKLAAPVVLGKCNSQSGTFYHAKMIIRPGVRAHTFFSRFELFVLLLLLL